MTAYTLGFGYRQSDRTVLLIEKQKPVDQFGLLNGVGGKLETSDRNEVECLVREYFEETNISTTADDWHLINVKMGNDFIIHVYAGILSEEKCSQIKQTTVEKPVFVPLSELRFSSNLPVAWDVVHFINLAAEKLWFKE